MKRFKLCLIQESVNGQSLNKQLGIFNSKQDAAACMNDYIRNANDDLTPFDFSLENVGINEVVTNYEEAEQYLNDGSVGSTQSSDRYIHALIALNKLFTIADAWNRDDNFEPDFSDENQEKWYPRFVYSNEAGKFIYNNVHNTGLYCYAYYGFQLCFKTAQRAKQFGEQFIDLWNEVLARQSK